MRPELKTKVKAIIKASKLSFVIHRGTLQHVLVSTFERPFDHEQIAGLPVIPRSRASDQNALPISAISHYFSGAQGRRIYHSARGCRGYQGWARVGAVSGRLVRGRGRKHGIDRLGGFRTYLAIHFQPMSGLEMGDRTLGLGAVIMPFRRQS